MLRVDNLNGRLQQHTQLRWRDICIAPCGVTLDPAALYRIGGGTSLASEPFSLPRASGDVFIDAEVGSKVKHWVGLGLMIGGVVAAGYGFVFWQFFNSFAENDTTSSRPGRAQLRAERRHRLPRPCGAVLETVGLPMFFRRDVGSGSLAPAAPEKTATRRPGTSFGLPWSAAPHEVRPVRAPRADRRGRYVRGFQRTRRRGRRLREARRDQAHPAGPRGGRALRQDAADRGAHPLRALAPQHRPDPRSRDLGGRRVLHRPRVRRGLRPARDHGADQRRGRDHPRGAVAAHRRRDRAGAELRARAARAGRTGAGARSIAT